MAGHSKWANIRHRKGRQDAKRGKVWSKVAKQIIVAAKAGGGDPTTNLTLRYAIDEGKSVNMPKDTIANAIKKGSGELEGVNYEEIVYEGYGPSGVAFLVTCLSDNRNRTAPEMRKLFEKGGGQLGANGCVSYLFEKKGTFVISADATDEETLMDLVLEAGAEDVISEDEGFEVTCETASYVDVKDALEAAGIETLSAELAMVPSTTISADDDTARKVLRLIDNIEDHDDVQKVYTNFDPPEHILEEL
jgi:YebC/PmpR family DNA-binding regulatory protein